MLAVVRQSVYQGNGDNGTSSTTVSATITGVAAGSAIIAFVGNDNTGPTCSVSDGNAYTQTADGTADNINGQPSRVFYLLNAAAGDHTVTATWSGAVPFRRLLLIEVAGLASSAAEDVSAHQGQASPGLATDAISSSATATTTEANTFVLGLTQNCSSAGAESTTLNAGTGYTLIGNRQMLTAEYKNVSTAGAQTATFTDTVANNSRTTHVVAFKLAAASGKLLIDRPTHRQQPNRAAEIDWSNPVTRGLQMLFDGARNRDVTTGRGFTPHVPTPCKDGLAHNVTGASSSSQLLNKTFVPGSGLTVLALVNHDAPNTGLQWQWFTGVGSYGANAYFSFGPIAGASIEVANNQDQYSGTIGSLQSAGTHSYAMTHENGTTLKGYVDGRQSGSATHSFSLPTGPQPVQLGAGQSDYMNEYFVGRYLLVAYWNRALSAAEIDALHRNPWQLFKGNLRILATIVASSVQLLVPTADLSAGGWTPSTGSDLYAMLDETTANDADYIVSTTASSCEMRVAAGSDPAVSTGHILRYRLLAGSGTISVALKQGTTTIASWGHRTSPRP